MERKNEKLTEYEKEALLSLDRDEYYDILYALNDYIKTISYCNELVSVYKIIIRKLR